MFLNPLQSKDFTPLLSHVSLKAVTWCSGAHPDWWLLAECCLRNLSIELFCLLKRELILLLSFMQGSNTFSYELTVLLPFLRLPH